MRFPTPCSAHRSPTIPESAFFEISDVLFCAQESQNSRTRMFFRFRTYCSAHRSTKIHESPFFEMSDVLFCAQDSHFRRFVLRTGVPEFLKVHFLRFPTFCSAHRSPRKSILLRFPTCCSAHRSPRIPRKYVFLFIKQICFCLDFRRVVLRTGVPRFVLRTGGPVRMSYLPWIY